MAFVDTNLRLKLVFLITTPKCHSGGVTVKRWRPRCHPLAVSLSRERDHNVTHWGCHYHVTHWRYHYQEMETTPSLTGGATAKRRIPRHHPLAASLSGDGNHISWWRRSQRHLLAVSLTASLVSSVTHGFICWLHLMASLVGSVNRDYIHW